MGLTVTAAEDASTIAPDGSFQTLQEEIESLRKEVQTLRQRDEMVHYYLHRLDEELRLAARLQQDFLPKELPKVANVRFQAMFRPAGYVSGDLYDVFRLDETHVGFYLADAIGHGVPSALLTMFLRTSLVSKEINSGGYRILTPGEAMSRLNASVLGVNFSQTTFATAVYGVIDAKSGEVSLSRAGHPCPILMPGEDSNELSEVSAGGGSLLGVFPDEVFPTATFRLSPGDRLLIHSDGIDAVYANHVEEPSKAWLNELTRMRQLKSAELLSEFSGRIDAQSGSLEPKDDLTIIIVEA